MLKLCFDLKDQSACYEATLIVPPLPPTSDPPDYNGENPSIQEAAGAAVTTTVQLRKT